MKKLIIFLLLFLWPIESQAAEGALSNASTLTVTAGGTWQTLFAQNLNRSTLWIENPATATSQGIVTAESLFIYFIPPNGTCLASGTVGAFELVAGGSLVMTPPYVSQQSICVYAATTSHTFQAAQTK